MIDPTVPLLPFDPDSRVGETDQSTPKTTTKTTTPGKKQEIKWKVVAEAPGITPAIIIANRLKEAGIPARAWQEGAGQALGLTIGLLGTGYVAVPEEDLTLALEILEDVVDDDFEE
jgi:hypothetical protein